MFRGILIVVETLESVDTSVSTTMIMRVCDCVCVCARARALCMLDFVCNAYFASIFSCT